ncbi:MAG: CDP-alcohol phosphatidyltransferase family protein [Patescibacteria group bacterium]
MKRNINIPNLLSTLRMLAALPIWLLLTANQPGWAFCVYLGALATDFLDGWIAAHYNQGTKLGMLLDPWADKVLHVTVMLLFLEKYPQLELQIYISIALAMVLVGLASAKLYFRVKRQLGANGFGKIKMCCEGFAIIALFLGYVTTGGILLWASIAFAVLSIVTHLLIREPSY